MTISTLGQELKIICGIPRAQGDANSAEDALQVLDLLAGIKGFSVEPGGWVPNLPQLKSSSVWADSALSDGRILLTAPVGNVTENITLTSNAATLQGRYFWEKELARFSRLAADFWQSYNQINPIYLKWWAPDAPGPQYALLYKIEIAGRGDPFSGDAVQEIVISLEREPYWRGIAPGDNPKKWTFEFRKQAYALGDLDLFSGNMDLIYDTTIVNKHEWTATPGTPGAQNTPLSRNYVDIPAENVPGDAPALLELTCAMISNLAPIDFYVALSSKATALINHLGQTKAQAYNLNAGDALANAGWAKTIDNTGSGVISNDSNINAYVNRYAFGGAGDSTTCEFGTTGSLIMLDRQLLRGQYMLFLRGSVSTGSSGDVTLSNLTIYEEENSAEQYVAQVSYTNIPIKMQASFHPMLHYIGMLTLPLGQRQTRSLKGYGPQIREGTTGNLHFVLTFHNKIAAARTVSWLDLVLVPVDEGINYVPQPAGTSSSNNPGRIIIDNSGYLAPNRTDSIANVFLTNEVSGGVASEVRGAPIYLHPGMDQRLYFVFSVYLNAASPAASIPAYNINVRGNIVPRWSGVRDV